MEKVTIFLLTLISSAALGQQRLAGYYSSNAAELGFFVTTIQLQEDSTFKYSSSGDLLHNSSSGRYRVEKKKILHLAFDPEPQKDSVALAELDLSGRSPTYLRLFYTAGKLYSFHLTEGHVVKRGQAMSRRKKFLFWGERYLTQRRLFLQRRKGKILE